MTEMSPLCGIIPIPLHIQLQKLWLCPKLKIPHLRTENIYVISFLQGHGHIYPIPEADHTGIMRQEVSEQWLQASVMAEFIQQDLHDYGHTEDTRPPQRSCDQCHQLRGLMASLCFTLMTSPILSLTIFPAFSVHLQKKSHPTTLFWEDPDPLLEFSTPSPL